MGSRSGRAIEMGQEAVGAGMVVLIRDCLYALAGGGLKFSGYVGKWGGGGDWGGLGPVDRNPEGPGGWGW